MRLVPSGVGVSAGRGGCAHPFSRHAFHEVEVRRRRVARWSGDVRANWPVAGRCSVAWAGMSSLTGQLRAHARIPLYRNAYALMLSGGASAALGVVYWVLASRFYSPEIVGRSSTAIAALGFLT